MPVSRGSSRPRDGTRVCCGSCIAGRCFEHSILVQTSGKLTCEEQMSAEGGQARLGDADRAGWDGGGGLLGRGGFQPLGGPREP